MQAMQLSDPRIRVNLLNQDKLSASLKGRLFDGVVHFAAKSLVGESFQKAVLYYRNNLVGWRTGG
mgnify:CR=1 FL=1